MNNKETLITQILKYWEKYPVENNTQRCINLLKKYDDDRVFYRDYFNDGHFTGSVLVINKDKTRVMMMHHKKFDTWQQFGGHADGEVDIKQVAIRELEEEAGILEKNIALSDEIFSFDIHSVPAHWTEPKHFHYDVCYMAIVSDDIAFIKQEEEVNDIQWFDITEVVSELGIGKFSSWFEHLFEKLSPKDT